MGTRLASLLISIMALTAMSAAAGAPDPSRCSSLIQSDLTKLQNTVIAAAEVVTDKFTPAGSGAQSDEAGPTPRTLTGLPPFCRVAVSVKPTPVSNISVEIWLPLNDWNGKFEGVGNGGLGGTISYPALAIALKRGFAAASTDDGHVASDLSWIGVDERERDYSYRAVHVMTETAKAVVKTFYGEAAKIAYFNGCSYGGSQGLGEAQLYPNDYDGILAGDPGNFLTRTRPVAIWNYQVSHKEQSSALSDPTLAMVTKAVLAECGGQNGSRDGFVDDPRKCSFNPEKLVCKADQPPDSCLTPAQAVAIQSLYNGPVDPGTKKQIWPGFLRTTEQPEGRGSVGWQSQAITQPAPDSRATAFFTEGLFKGQSIDFKTVDIKTLIKVATDKFPYLAHPITNLDPFLKHGKLLVYHGWVDPAITPENSINYFGSVVEASARAKHVGTPSALKTIQDSMRLFVVPGMGHCQGGPGPSTFDALAALVNWVEKNQPPDQILASHVVKGETTLSRPICPYPQAAEYSGSGDRNSAQNWTCKETPFTYDSSFYQGQPAH